MRISNGFFWWNSVHPYACGEHSKKIAKITVTHRFIPTRVGNIHAALSFGNGETGSSPRVWGTFSRRDPIDHKQPVHPHACGEHSAPLAICRAALRFIPTRVGNMFVGGLWIEDLYGSSPRVWGTCDPVIAKIHAVAVHPHACGEHVFLIFPFFLHIRFIPTRVGNIH